MGEYECYPGDARRNIDPEKLRTKALAEFVGGSHESKMKASRTIWNKLLPVLDEWAQQNGYKRRELRFGGHRTLWFPTSGDPRNLPIDSIELLLAYILPDEFSALETLIGTLSQDLEFGLRKILAGLILHELGANNLDGAVMAADAFDKNSERVRTLAEGQLIRSEALREYARRGARTNREKGDSTAAEIWRHYDELMETGKEPREAASIIAKKVGRHPATVRRHLRGGRDSKE